MKVPPRVFISYSHDSIEHKGWVLDLATTLRNRGVDSVLDQWDLQPGDDVPHFMETNLDACDFVVMVCTGKYVEKANGGTGGVGYEKMIMTQSLMKRIDDSKVIPIIRQNGTNKVPTFMGSKLYIDFSNDDEIEFALDELVRKLLGVPLYEKPEIGTNPFKPMEHSRPDRVSDGLKSVMNDIAQAFEGESTNFIHFSKLVSNTKMHRLTLDRYAEEARERGLILMDSERCYVELTPDGRNYIFEHGLVSE